MKIAQPAQFIIFFCFLAVSSIVSADTLELRNGSTLQGAYQGGTTDSIKFYFNGISQDFPRSSVASIKLSEETPAVPVGAGSTAAAAPAPAQPTAPVSHIELPAGTTLVASLQTPLNSGSVRPGQTFPAVLVSDVRVGNDVVLTAGTQLQGEVVTAGSAGRGFRKDAELSFTINAINYQGRLVAIRTSTQQQANQGNGAKETVGGAARGAALGAIFGAITGDAGEGAAAGAAAGGAGGFIRKGDDIEYQSGSVLAFTLESSAKL
ncbi:MAG: glycine zipper family protein [Verrucomicrobiota bacterium]